MEKDTKKVFAKISGKDVNKFTEKSIQTLIKMEWCHRLLAVLVPWKNKIKIMSITSSKRISTSKCDVCNHFSWNFLEFFWNNLGILLEFFWRIFLEDFFDGIFLVEFFGRHFLGGFFWENFFGRIFLGGIFLGGLLRGVQQKVIWIWKELICLSRFWFLSRFWVKERKEENLNL